MNFSFFIAKRYFSTNKHKNFVHIISWVSLFGITIGSSALILVLSVFNGFEDLILGMYNSFDPHIKIVSKEGKTFSPNNIVLSHPEIASTTYVLEEKALLKLEEKEFIATVKGVSSSYDFDKFDINYNFPFDSLSFYEPVAIMGKGLTQVLGRTGNLQVFASNRDATISNLLSNPNLAFNQANIPIAGDFFIQSSEINDRYVFTPLFFIQDLTERDGEISAIEVTLKDLNKMLDIQPQIEMQMGEDFIVKNRLEQQEFIYKILNTEKLVVFLILLFTMILAMFNISGSLTMLMLDKENDIKTFKSFGVDQDHIKSIFLTKGILTVVVGTFIGLCIGLAIAFLQQYYPFINFGVENVVVSHYPIAIRVQDIFIVIFSVLFVGILGCWYPAKVLSKKLFNI